MGAGLHASADSAFGAVRMRVHFESTAPCIIQKQGIVCMYILRASLLMVCHP